MELISDEVTREDFLQSGLEDVVAGCGQRRCSAYTSCFAARALEAGAAGDSKGQQIYWLLRDITSMHMKLDSPEEPFGPLAQFNGGRTAMVGDLDEGNLRLLGEVVGDIGDPELRARIADVLWLRKRDFRIAELAVSAYLESAKVLEDPEQWVSTNQRIERALQIAVRLGKNTGSYAAVIDHIENVLNTYNGEDPLYLSAKMMRMLQERKAGDPAKYAALAEKLALSAEVSRDWRRAEEYWEIKAQWHRMNKDEEQDRDARVRAAETHVQDAEDALKREPPSHLHAAAFMQRAIVAFRRIEGTRERVRELHERLLEYQKRSTSELAGISSSADVSELVRRSVDGVKGKSLQDALLSLAMLGSPPRADELRANVIRDREKYIFHRIMPNVYMNAMGRVVARQPLDEDEAVMADMYQRASLTRSLHAQAVVEPARQQVISEHYVRLDDFVPLVSNNPFIPPQRMEIIARGLYAGLQGDFLSATHFLIPQLEASVRYILYQLRVITSGLDDEGIQDEYNLNRLLSASEYSAPLATVIGDDLVFDLRGLLVERFGSNLRNEMAHGLLNLNAFYSTSACYLWWIVLRFYSYPTFARLRQEQDGVEEGE